MPEPKEESESSELNPASFRKGLAAFSFQENTGSTPRRRVQSTPIETPSPRRRARKASNDSKPYKSTPRARSPRPKAKRGFAPAEQYEHLKPLPDYFAPNLDSKYEYHLTFFKLNTSQNLFNSCVLWDQVFEILSFKILFSLTRHLNSPGQKSAEIGHHFGNPTNHFWPCLYESGQLISLFGIGSRPSLTLLQV